MAEGGEGVRYTLVTLHTNSMSDIGECCLLINHKPRGVHQMTVVCGISIYNILDDSNSMARHSGCMVNWGDGCMGV